MGRPTGTGGVKWNSSIWPHGGSQAHTFRCSFKSRESGCESGLHQAADGMTSKQIREAEVERVSAGEICASSMGSTWWDVSQQLLSLNMGLAELYSCTCLSFPSLKLFSVNALRQGLQGPPGLPGPPGHVGAPVSEDIFLGRGSTPSPGIKNRVLASSSICIQTIMLFSLTDASEVLVSPFLDQKLLDVTVHKNHPENRFK